MRVGSLFSGIGGFDLGFERAGMSVAWQSEVDPFACAVLRKHWPHVPNHGDIRFIRGDAVEPVDVLCGGFPCQPYSVAGKGLGKDDSRDLWPEYARLVRELRPRWVVAENVPALRTRGYDRVADDLEAAGYTVQAFVVGADDIGAPHRRKRVWIVAYADTRRREQQRRGGLLDGERPAFWHDADRCAGARVSADALASRLPGAECAELPGTQRHDERRTTAERGTPYPWAARAPEPTVRRVDAWFPNRLDANRRPRLAALGNALVPQIAEAIGRAIMRVNEEPLNA